ncbi:MAG: GtrA family protein [Parcubacteria group bacterium Greene0714_36]|nr:MAG: GtrA family protein [Parcubacteria group bacterium Greene0714_36]
MTMRIDYAIAPLVGFFAGITAVPTAYAVGVQSPAALLALPWVGAACILFGIWLGGFLSRWMPIFSQMSKFAAVGILNTAIDFGVLNILSIASGVASGLIVGGINIPGFGVAVINSYFWNKLWVFGDKKTREPILSDFPKFFAVTLVGLALNSAIVILLTTTLPFFSLLGPGSRLNAAKAVATLANLTWNFAGYKLIVFRPSLSENEMKMRV